MKKRSLQSYKLKNMKKDWSQNIKKGVEEKT